MDRSGIGQDHLDDANVDAQGYRTGALIRTLAAVLDQLVAIEVSDLLFAEVMLPGCEGCRLAAAGWFPYGAHIGYMKVDQVSGSVHAGYGRSVGRQSLID